MRLIILAALLSCQGDGKDYVDVEPIDTAGVLQDLDGDGFFSDEDCDDNDPQVYPGVDEICDGFDNNCDGQVDEGVLEVFYEDNDNDGFGNVDVTTEACDTPEGYTPNGNDCNYCNLISHIQQVRSL